MKYTVIPEPDGYAEALAAAMAKLSECGGVLTTTGRRPNYVITLHAPTALPSISLATATNHPHGWYRKFEKRNKRK